ncbi:pyridoxamine 5'-phosphate oxidase family protein [Croceicoccus bisphenolivorans]|uniref:pyridoxamine 5'-phosphate oxidase family protein n=1 Tax=Croceicoccus bisphenolivorans TaxID=1783232 RepID=UPI0008370A7B|nr:pyridoxamine 5'-phosphate oxidase family protein [Croceicoccus bisphenolivorans]
MAQFFDALDERHGAMIAAQPVFFVATAAPSGRVNLSPKGYDAFRIIGPNRVAYLDLAGSGNETHAHLAVDPRITIMFCNFANPAMILRIYGRGRPVLAEDEGWSDLAEHFTILPGTRQIFDIEVQTVQTSCGYGVPYMEFERERPTLTKYHAQTGEDEWLARQQGRNSSIDGLPVRPPKRYFGSGQGQSEPDAS